MSSFARYKISHRTRYQYSAPVAICQNQLRMSPRSFSDRLVQVECHRSQTTILPEPDFVDQHQDYFGNNVYTFSIESSHQELDVHIESEVTVHREDWPELDSPISWSSVMDEIASSQNRSHDGVKEFCFDSPRIQRHPRFAEYASASFADGRSIDEAVMHLTRKIHQEFRYDTLATDVDTSTEQAFEQKAGVCQDFAHVQIACLRSLGFPARYVSGYLRTLPREGQQRLVGADESHAWVSVYMGNELGWVDVDPTNDCWCDTNHIPLCLGRDYSEVSPMRGVVLGGGKTRLSVQVDVALLAEG